jgi:ABC-type multidrug transport system ATPase subunit
VSDVIRIEHLTKRFGRAIAVNDVSISVAAGEGVALWGANGAGKTTIIRCVLGLLRYRGRITVGAVGGVGGWDATRRGKRARRLIGYVPQELGFYDELCAGEAVRFFARLKGVRVPDAGDELRRVGLDGHERKRIRELSGGMKQRLALAIALIGDPPVLILDEVTASLDACGREEFVALLASLASRGRSLLFASHRIEEVRALADRVIVLDQGRMTADLPPDQLARGSGSGMLLHLRLENGSRTRAIDVLGASGFDATRNGIGILVPVEPEHKGAPLRILAEARIPIIDFEVVGAPGRGHRGIGTLAGRPAPAGSGVHT